MENADLKYIKKHYSEKMAYLCRELFPTILEHHGLLPMILEKKFAHSSSLAEDIISEGKQGKFRAFILSMIDENIKPIDIKQTKTPKELLDEAGYILYPECKTEEDIQSFKHYYAKGEELCTFKGGRLDSCRVWFAVKKDVDQIKREDFKNPERQDTYGTSVISIQFSKNENSWLSIKNRYNHTVANPDATFSNNLDNIIIGLSNAFRQNYNLKFKVGDDNFILNNYIMAGDGKYYRYNYEIDNIYYCDNNIKIHHGMVEKYDPARYIIMDYFIVDMQKPCKIFTSDIYDSFVASFGKILSVSVERDENKNKVVRFKVKNGEDVLVTLNKYNQIIKLDNKNVVEIGDNFLYCNNAIQEINLPAVETISKRFLGDNTSLNKLYLPSVRIIRDCFLYCNNSLTELNLPCLTDVQDCFLVDNDSITKVNLPQLVYVGNNFISGKSIEEFNAPLLAEVGNCFLENNTALKKLCLPSLSTVGYSFLSKNRELEELYLPSLTIAGNNFLNYNEELKTLDLPLLEKVDYGFFHYNDKVEKVKLPNLDYAGEGFMFFNDSLKELVLPKLRIARSDFLHFNKSIKKLELPKLSFIGSGAFAFHPESASLLNEYKDKITDLQK